MFVEQVNGKLKTLNPLNTVTREQLYLAIRLACVQQHCLESKPLPLILNDILVNFDEQRAKNTLHVLLALPDHIQVLFLTCHEHMTELVRKSRPDISPIELSAVWGQQLGTANDRNKLEDVTGVAGEQKLWRSDDQSGFH